MIDNVSFNNLINDIIEHDDVNLIKFSLIDVSSISSLLKFFIKDFINDFDELTLKQNEENQNFIFSLSRRTSIINLFEKMFYVRINMKLKSFIITFDL